MLPCHQLNIGVEDYALLTDLYQLTMGACYAEEGIAELPASFELFVRRLPPHFGYLVAMGIAQVVDYLQNLHFSPKQIKALQETRIFAHVSDRFWRLLKEARFVGDLWAVPEGTVVFAHEPILRITAPLWQAQLVETYVLNTINYQTMIATKSARLRDVAGDQAILLEFGTRRAFSPQASLWSARASLASGMDATSNVLAALQLGRTPRGTMAHSLVMALTALEGSEIEAFKAFLHYFPNSPLLIDTYDPLQCAQQLAQHRELEVTGVRLDSGDMAETSQQVRSLLPHATIYASGDMDEWEIQRLQQAGACIDGYGIGTKLVTGQPVNGVYKLVEINGIPVSKKSAGKQTYGYAKQIWRSYQDGLVKEDVVTRADRTPNSGQPLLELVIKAGALLKPLDDLETIALRVRENVRSLPQSCRDISQPTPPSVTIDLQLEL